MARTPNLVKAAVAAACACMLFAGCSHSAKRSATPTSRAEASTSSALAPSTTAGVATTAPPASGQTTRLGDKDSGKSTRVELGYFPPAKGAKAETTYVLSFTVS